VNDVVDVVVVGAGPVGLMLAGELRLSGVTPLVLERLTERSPVPKANGLVGQVVRFLDHRGLYTRLTGDTRAPRPIPTYMFGGLPLPVGLWADSPLTVLPLPQWDLEGGLGEWVAEAGVEVRRGVEVTGCTQDDDGVTVDYVGPQGPGSVRAKYVVGCDGGHSVVRKQMGVEFRGVSSDRVTSHSAHVVFGDGVLDRAGMLALPGAAPLAPFAFHRTERGVFVFGAFKPGTPLVSAMEWDRPPVPDDAPVTVEDLRAAVHRVLGVDVPMSPPTTDGRFVLRRVAGGNTRQADRYRVGRVLLAGDAAHVHSAVGGPGLNLGLLDVANLGWKLAATVHGFAPEGLLDTYHGERHPVGQRVVMHTQAQSALLAPGGEVTGLRTLMTELLAVPDNARRIAEMLTGADTRYASAGDTTHPLAGRWVPDFPLTVDGRPTRLAQLARTGRALLLDFTGDPAVAAVAAGWRDRVDLIQGSTPRPPAPALLIRADGHAAWLAGTNPESSALGSSALELSLPDALRTWFGESL
jgi:2-polyprenyl-6-methoxyphenol hydroxylase-like FAD-dependent oxidoreductase